MFHFIILCEAVVYLIAYSQLHLNPTHLCRGCFLQTASGSFI